MTSRNENSFSIPHETLLDSLNSSRLTNYQNKREKVVADALLEQLRNETLAAIAKCKNEIDATTRFAPTAMASSQPSSTESMPLYSPHDQSFSAPESSGYIAELEDRVEDLKDAFRAKLACSQFSTSFQTELTLGARDNYRQRLEEALEAATKEIYELRQHIQSTQDSSPPPSSGSAMKSGQDIYFSTPSIGHDHSEAVIDAHALVDLVEAQRVEIGMLRIENSVIRARVVEMEGLLAGAGITAAVDGDSAYLDTSSFLADWAKD